MTWRCSRCGSEGNAAETRDCAAGCGYYRAPEAVVLTSRESGQSLSFRVSTPVGRRLLERLDPDGASRCSNPQFELHRSAEGRWSVRHMDSATHPTFLGRTALSSDLVELVEDCELSIADLHCRLAVVLRD